MESIATMVLFETGEILLDKAIGNGIAVHKSYHGNFNMAKSIKIERNLIA